MGRKLQELAFFVGDGLYRSDLIAFFTIKQQSYSRKIWYYDRANYDLYRQRLLGCNWNLQDKSVDENVTIISEHILNSADLSIPSQIVTIRPMDSPLKHNQIRKEIMKGKNSINLLKPITMKMTGLGSGLSAA